MSFFWSSLRAWAALALHALFLLCRWLLRAALLFSRKNPRTALGIVLCLVLVALGSKGPSGPPPLYSEEEILTVAASAGPGANASASAAKNSSAPQKQPPAPKKEAKLAPVPPVPPVPPVATPPAEKPAAAPSAEPDFAPEPELTAEQREESFWQLLWNTFGSKGRDPQRALDVEARRVEEALLPVLGQFEVPPRDIRVLDRESRLSAQGEVYPYLRMVINRPELQKPVTLALDAALREHGSEARLVREGERLFHVVIGGSVSHSLFFQIPPDAPEPGSLPPGPALTLVMDDLGDSLDVIRRLAALPYPVTLAIMPGTGQAGRASTLGRDLGREVLVHQPMEPLKDTGFRVGKDGMTLNMKQDAMGSILRHNLMLVPDATGLNNHMGSRFTSHGESVRRFCEELRATRPDFLVLDSLTLGASVFYEQARNTGFNAFRRAVFLDDEPKAGVDARVTVDSVLAQLDEAARQARQNGHAVAIGHPRKATIAALERWQGWRSLNMTPLAALPLNPLPE